MSYKILSIKDNILELHVTGKITLDDELNLLKEVEKEIKIKGKINLLVHLESEIHMELKAISEDLKGFFKFGESVEKVAFVSDRKLWEFLTTVSKPIMAIKHIKTKFFLQENLTEAWEWVK